MKVWGLQHSHASAWTLPEPARRAINIAIPFALWHPATTQATDIALTLFYGAKNIVRLDKSLYSKGLTDSTQPAIKAALSVLSVAGLVFSHHLIRLPAAIVDLINSLLALTKRYSVDEFTRLAAAIIECLRSVLYLVLKVCVVAEVTLAIAVFNILIKLVYALQEIELDRWPEALAHFTMAGLRAKKLHDA